MAPGPYCWQAFAQQVGQQGVPAQSISQQVSVVPVNVAAPLVNAPAMGAMTAPLANVKLDMSLKSHVPVSFSRGARRDSMGVSGRTMAVRGPRAQGRQPVQVPVAQQPLKSKPGSNLMRIIRQDSLSAEDAALISPDAKAMGSAGSAREWAQTSFDVLKDAPASGNLPIVSVIPAIPAPGTAGAEGSAFGAGTGLLQKASQGHLREDFLGFRWIRGLRHDPGIKALPRDADVPRILEQISKQFSLPMAKVVEMAERYNLPLDGNREAWLAVYDKMLRGNREEFQYLDHKKYQDSFVGEAWSRGRYALFGSWAGKVPVLGRWLTKKPEDASFRKLVNKTYAEGAKGLLQRAMEAQKHLAGFFIRLPYHVFDSFLFGYFRRSISFEFKHKAEDFFTIAEAQRRADLRAKGRSLTSEEMRPLAERWLEGALSEQSFSKGGLRSKVFAARLWREFDHWFWTPFMVPLFQFMTRRLAMAVTSAVAMGLMAPLAPLGLMSVSVLSMPVLGTAVMAVSHAVPAAAGVIPLIGPALSGIFSAALNNLASDLVVGPMLNSLVLSSMLTFPSAMKSRLMDSRRGPIRVPSLLSAEYWKAAGLTLLSGKFWSQNLKSFAGLMTVGAEIEGIMTSASAIDGFLNRGYQAAVPSSVRGVLGKDFRVIASIGEAIERPREWRDAEGNIHKNRLPFGGAITWGNVLFYKLQDAAGFNLTDAIAERLTGLAAVALPVGAMRGARRLDPSQPEFSPEILAAMRNLQELRAGVQAKDKELARLQAGAKPVTPEERAAYEKALKELQASRDEAYIRSKLAELQNLEHPLPQDHERLKRLKELQDFYGAKLPETGTNPGRMDSAAVHLASLKTVQNTLESLAQGVRSGHSQLGESHKADPAIVKDIEALVAEIEQLRQTAKTELAHRDATSRLLSIVNGSRNAALEERRSGKSMFAFHKDLARLAMVMDIAFGLNQIASAQKAIAGMQKLLDKKLEKIQDVKHEVKQDQEENKKMKDQYDQWEKEVEDTLKDNDAQKTDMAKFADQTGMAVERITGFRDAISAALNAINGKFGGASNNVLIEANRRLALLTEMGPHNLPKLQDWRTYGKPGDPDYVSMKKLQDNLKETADIIAKIDAGAPQLDTVPTEFAGPVIYKVPGIPDAAFTDHTIEGYKNLLAVRKAHWQAKLAGYKKDLDNVSHRLDPSYGDDEPDDFGDTNPVSLDRWLRKEQGAISGSQAELQVLALAIDGFAASVEKMSTGAALPRLSGLVSAKNLKGLQDAVESYADKISAIQFQAQTDQNKDDLFHAKMDLLALGKFLPSAGYYVILWSRSDAYVKEIEKAKNQTLPPVKRGFEQVVSAVNAILADVDADIAYINSRDFSLARNQQVIDRKKALLPGVRSAVQSAHDMIVNQLIPYQQDSIKTVAPDSDYSKLFNAQITLYNATAKALDRTLPWALASWGAKDGDVPGAMANIQAQKKTYWDVITGYDDSKGLEEYRVEVEHRKDPNYPGPETTSYLKDSNYPDGGPMSLPRKIELYGKEKVERAGQFNRQSIQINDILAKLDQATKNSFNLRARFTLPTNIDGTSPASKDAMQKLRDNETFQKLGDVLKQMEEKYKADTDNVKLTPDGLATGEQPSPKLDPDTQIALTLLQLARRLVPSTHDATSAAYALARYLYADGNVSSSKEALAPGGQIEEAERFIQQGLQALNNALNDLSVSERYVQSNGTTEASDAVVEREIAVYQALNAFTASGVAFFEKKNGWDKDSFDTIDEIKDYYDSIEDINDNALDIAKKEAEAVRKMKETLQKTYNDLEKKRQEIAGWMAKLNPKEESALNRIAKDLREIQSKTYEVLKQNQEYRLIEAQHKRAEEIVQWSVRKVDDRQRDLQKLLVGVDPQTLPQPLVHRIQGLSSKGDSWMIGPEGNDASQALVVRKADFPYFIDQIFSVFRQKAPGQNLASIQQQILSNPQSLAELIPSAKVLNFGDDADGFYIVYQSELSVPNGLETSFWVTAGNVANVLGSNVSVSGYQYASPGNEGNAPSGNKGVGVQIESLRGANWVNYLNIDFHRFIQDIPSDITLQSSSRQSRMLVFDDFAMFLFGDRLYVGMTGFGDWALSDTAQKPSFYGGSFKTSVKFTEVMRLNAEQQQVFAKDPRTFLETVNLDFTGLDPDLNKDFVIDAKGEKKHFSRTQIGPNFDVGRLLGSKDAFNMDFYFARQEGTDDYTQNSMGVSVLKGFTIQDAQGKPWMTITNKASGELGQKQNIFSDRVSVNLPDYGLAFSAEGRLLGKAKTGVIGISKAIGDHGGASVQYGSPYPGMNNRLSVSMNSSFTLGELWRSVTKQTAEDFAGGDVSKRFNQELDDFFKAEEPHPQAVADLKTVYMQDVGRKLIAQDIGKLAREIAQLRRAGAIFDNVRMRGMIGFVSGPVSDSEVNRTLGGGPSAGTVTDLTMTKSQKALIDSRIQHLYREGQRLEARMFELTKDWQAAVEEIAQAQWELKVAKFMKDNAQTPAIRAQGQVELDGAQARLNQALVRYNVLSGRDAGEPVPFDNLNTEDLRALIAELRTTLRSPERLTSMFRALDAEELSVRVGQDSFNLLDSIPFIDRLTLSVGLQFQDLMANQQFGVGATVSLPVYSPLSTAKEHAYQLDAEATIHEMQAVYQEYELKARQEGAQARYWESLAEALRSPVRQSADALSGAIPAYRNALIPEHRLQEAFNQWRWYINTLLQAEGKAALARSWSGQNSMQAGEAKDNSPLTLRSIADAFQAASSRSHKLAEIAARQEAAAGMAQANAHRIQKFNLDLYIGMNVTATGTAWIPGLSMTGLPVIPVPIFELKPRELAELQAQQGKGETELYRHLKAKVEISLATQFFNSAAALQTSEEAYRVMEQELLPRLQAELDRAQTQGDAGAAAKAKLALTQAQAQRNQLWLISAEARQTINFLLGRSPEAPLQLDMNLEEALQGLKNILDAKKPVDTDKAILDSRVKIALAEETKQDKDLKVDDLKIEPVSLFVRSLGRLVSALSSDETGNPDRAMAAHIQALETLRSREQFERDLPARRSMAAAELSLARQREGELAHAGDPASKVQRLQWRQRALLLEAGLRALGGTETQASAGSVPLSFAELTGRVKAAYERSAPGDAAAPLDVADPEHVSQGSKAQARYFYATADLDKKAINKGYIETWLELRLNSKDTPEEVLLALFKLRDEKADRIRRAAVNKAGAEAQVLAAQFESDVLMLRWAKRAASSPGTGRFQNDFAKFERELTQRLEAQKDKIVAVLHLPSATTLDDLARLVKHGDAGAQDGLEAITERFLASVRRVHIDRLRQEIFSSGLPGAPAPGYGAGTAGEEHGLPAANEDNLMHQIQADVLVKSMTYKGFTPAAAWGVFQGRGVWAVALESPDPRAVERGLVNILSDSLRKELESQGRMKELSLKLHLLMRGVQDKAKLLESQHQRVLASQETFRATLAQERAGAAAVSGALMAAQDDLVAAWTDLARTMADLKSDFITLVTELEALGLGDRMKSSSSSSMALAARSRDQTPAGDAVRRQDPAQALAMHLSGRMLDERFAARLDEVLAGMQGVDPKLRSDLRRAGEAYRLMTQDADAVRHMDFEASKKLELLAAADTEGRRQEVQSLLSPLVERLNSGKGVELLRLVREDLASGVQDARTAYEGDAEVLASMRDAYWRAGQGTPPAVEGAYQRMSGLYKEMASARQAVLEDYVAQELKPSDFILRNVNLDLYLKAQQAYDAEVIKTFESKEVKDDPSLAWALDELFDLRASLARQQDLLRFGRGMSAINAQIMLQEARLAAQRYERALPSAMRETLLALENLQALKKRWLENPRELVALYAVTETDGQRRLWSIKGWHTQKEIDEMKRPHEVNGSMIPPRIATDEQGRMWLDGKALEVFSGVDAVHELREAAVASEKENKRNLDVFAALHSHEFALVGMTDLGANRSPGANQPEPSTEIEGIDYKRVMELGSQGRLFYFSRTKDGSGLNPALHPVQALWTAPADTEIIAYTGEQKLSRAMFPTRQSLEAFINSLKTSEDAKQQAEVSMFMRLEAGQKGVQALLENAGKQRLKSLRAGWMGLKLNSHGFAFDANGLAEVYLTEAEFDAALKALRQAPKVLDDVRQRLAKLQADAKRMEPEVRRLREQSEDANLNYQQVQQASDIKSPEFRAAQKTMADAVEAFNKVHEQYLSAQRKADLAQSDVEAAQAMLANAGTWRLFESRDIELTLDAGNDLVAVAVDPVYGRERIKVELDAAHGPVRSVKGEVYAAVMDRRMNIRKLYQDPGGVKDASEQWVLQEVNGRRWTLQGRAIDPNFRLMQYVDPKETAVDPASGGTYDLPVSLNRKFMFERLDGAQGSLFSAKHSGLMPRHWIPMLLEVPMGILKTPVELVAGYDPNQRGYLGRVNMNKTEGGATPHHNAIGQVVHGVLYLLNLSFEQADRFYDPSQFPSEVQLSSPLRPSDTIFEKSSRAKDKDIHYGVGSIQRAIAYDLEDVLNAKRSVFTHFEGGVETTLLETRLGRGRLVDGRAATYQTSRVMGAQKDAKGKDLYGKAAIEQALSDPWVAEDPGSDGRGIVILEGRPGHYEVDQVVKRVRVEPGARQYDQASKNLQLQKVMIGLQEQNANAISAAASEYAVKMEQRYRGALEELQKVVDSESDLWEQTHSLAWRIGEQQALEAGMRSLQAEITKLRQQIVSEQARLDRLLAAWYAQHGQQVQRLSWAFLAAFLGLAAFLLWELLKGLWKGGGKRTRALRPSAA